MKTLAEFDNGCRRYRLIERKHRFEGEPFGYVVEVMDRTDYEEWRVYTLGRFKNLEDAHVEYDQRVEAEATLPKVPRGLDIHKTGGSVVLEALTEEEGIERLSNPTRDWEEELYMKSEGWLDRDYLHKECTRRWKEMWQEMGRALPSLHPSVKDLYA